MSYKSFVSHSVIDNNQEQVIDKQANEDTSTEPAVEYDPRTLYERLQEQKNKKEEEFREATRFSNLVKRIDPEEAAYYKSLSDTQQQLDEQVKKKEMEELEEYRRAVEQARTESTPTTAATTTVPTTSVGVKPVAKPKKDLFGGIVVMKKKKRTADQLEDPEEIPAKAKKDNTSAKAKMDEAPANKKDDTPKDTSPSPKKVDKAPVGLTSLLAAYDDSDSD